MAVQAAQREGSIAGFMQQMIKMQQDSAKQADAMCKALEESDEAKAGKKREHFEMVLKVSRSVADSYLQSAKDLMQIQTASNDTHVDQLRRLVDLHFHLKNQEYDHMRKQVDDVLKDNRELREENRKLRRDNRGAIAAARVPLHKWEVTKPGLNLQGRCTKPICKARDQRVNVHLGPGKFNFGDVVYDANCTECNTSLADVNRITFENCSYSYEAVTRGKEEKKKSGVVEGAHTLDVNVSDWAWGKITVTLDDEKGP